jgi:hypothetical protein
MLNYGHACRISSQGAFAFQLLSKITKIKNIQNHNFACCLYGCKTSSLALSLRMFENKVTRKVFGPKR